MNLFDYVLLPLSIPAVYWRLGVHRFRNHIFSRYLCGRSLVAAYILHIGDPRAFEQIPVTMVPWEVTFRRNRVRSMEEVHQSVMQIYPGVGV